MDKLDLFSIGEMVIDFIPGSEAHSYIRTAGGAPANVAIMMAKNDLRTGMCCSVGDDDFGRFLIRTLEEEKVEVLNKNLCKEAITTMAFVTLNEEGDRSFTFARKPGADMFLNESHVKAEDIDRSIIVHAGSCSLSASPAAEATILALKMGHENNKLISFDLNYRDLMWNSRLDAFVEKVFEVLPYVDFLKISEEELPLLGGESPAELMQRFGLTLLIETLGPNGARCFYKDEVYEIPGREAVAVDTTGAGDAFWGAFLSSLRIQDVTKLEDLSADKIRKAMQFGNIAGWICIQKKGAIVSLPDRATIEKYL